MAVLATGPDTGGIGEQPIGSGNPRALGATPVDPIALDGRQTGDAVLRQGASDAAGHLPPVSAAAVAPLPAPDADASLEPMSTTRPAPRVRAGGTMSTLSVTLGQGDEGAIVSVIGGSDGPADEERLHHTVARMLARHGLTLGQLRIARRPSGEGRQRGNG